MEKTVTYQQYENGIYEAEIRDQYGNIESAIIAKPPSEVWQWAIDHDVELSNVFLKDLKEVDLNIRLSFPHKLFVAVDKA